MVTVTGESSGTSDPSGGGSGAYPNEPAGFARWAEHDMSCIPGSPGCLLVRGSARQDSWMEMYSVVQDPTAPGGTAVRIRYRKGHPDGQSPGRFFIWNKGSAADATPLGEWYVSLWFQFEGVDWEVPPATLKFWYNRNHGTVIPNLGGMTVAAPAPAGSIVQQFGGWRFWYYPSQTASSTNAYASAPGPVVGRWYHLEQVVQLEGKFGLGDDGLNQGRVRTWVDGELIQDEIKTQWAERPFREFHWAPVWGGVCSGGCPKVRDDFLLVGNVYISGR
jgi:hypothetical protein